MSFKRTWIWLLVAGGLLAFIVFFQRQAPAPSPEAARILPHLKPNEVTSVQIAVPGQKDLRAERTNDTWQLTQPLSYPAQSASVETLLTVLAQLTPATRFSQTELTNRADADKAYGFTDAQATILLEQPGESFSPIRIGAHTAPGNQVFVQVVGRDDIYVVDASLLKYIPRSPNAWRDTSFLRVKSLAFDTLTVVSGNNRLSFQSDPATHLWRMTYPFEGRADNEKIAGFLQALERSRIQEFVSDQTNAELAPFGLEPPEHEVVFAQGTNVVRRLQFGKSPANDARQVYARRLDRNGIVALPKEVLLPWSASMQMADYRDPYLLHISGDISAVEVGMDKGSFSLERQTNNTWRVLPEGFAADSGLVNELLAQLNQLRIAEFTKDTILDTSLEQYGLAPQPFRRFVVRGGPAGAPGTATNRLADLSFGLDPKRMEVVYARRADEKSVYAVQRLDFDRLPALFDYQMRERRVFHFSINDVIGATLVQEGRIRQLKRNGPHSWSLLPGSQGTINDLAVEETVEGLCEMGATRWVGRGEGDCKDYGLTPGFLKITLDLKNGEKATMTLAKPTAHMPPLASVMLDGQPWAFEFPATLLPDVLNYLTVP